MINPFLTKPNYVRIYGHRGARGDMVENSISGLKYAFDLGIRAVEFDVVISKDNIPVLFHDYRLNPDLVKDSSGNWITDKNMKLSRFSCVLFKERASCLIHGRDLEGPLGNPIG